MKRKKMVEAYETAVRAWLEAHQAWASDDLVTQDLVSALESVKTFLASLLCEGEE